MTSHAVQLLVELRTLHVEIALRDDILLASMHVKPLLDSKIQGRQISDPYLRKMKDKVQQGMNEQFALRHDGMLLINGRICVPNIRELKEEILNEAHYAPYPMHPGSTKMYRDLQSFYWWSTMKKDTAECVAKCLTCQQVKAEHQALAGNWDEHLPLIEFAYNNSYHSSIGMAPYEALYGRRCRSPVCWDMDGLRQLEDPELIQETVDKIQIVKKCLKAAQDRQKSYMYKHRREMEYEVGEKVFLRVSP
ncbi:uncharacterized protein LOC112536241 [Ricinus communis]|uniref:uncharacterized protein LOC112536241 n=1 Tax=Ricinus communis TaxID=3988 RepID=UPI00201B10ED|nr:uncharacterized protein LOC112536241 [Ricinus communis]